MNMWVTFQWQKQIVTIFPLLTLYCFRVKSWIGSDYTKTSEKGWGWTWWLTSWRFNPRGCYPLSRYTHTTHTHKDIAWVLWIYFNGMQHTKECQSSTNSSISCYSYVPNLLYFSLILSLFLSLFFALLDDVTVRQARNFWWRDSFMDYFLISDMSKVKFSFLAGLFNERCGWVLLKSNFFFINLDLNNSLILLQEICMLILYILKQMHIHATFFFFYIYILLTYLLPFLPWAIRAAHIYI